MSFINLDSIRKRVADLAAHTSSACSKSHADFADFRRATTSPQRIASCTSTTLSIATLRAAGTRVERVPSSITTPQWNERPSAKFLCGDPATSPSPTMEWLPNPSPSE